HAEPGFASAGFGVVVFPCGGCSASAVVGDYICPRCESGFIEELPEEVFLIISPIESHAAAIEKFL
uniref:Uncharacterized protein n=1 Tax=Falco tinnunculus TaxID=100819 RepID=A0A8C4U1N7_FALTI